MWPACTTLRRSSWSLTVQSCSEGARQLLIVTYLRDWHLAFKQLKQS